MSETADYHAEYYDAFTGALNDIAFYLGFVDSDTEVLELGCGTGRVTAALLPQVQSIVGVDLSRSMLQRASDKLGSADICIHGDITNLHLGRQFDLIIAPFRVLQSLEHQSQVEGLFRVIADHLKPNGLAILNVFHPNLSKKDMPLHWCQEERVCGEALLSEGDLVTLSDRKAKLDADRQILYPDLIYRRYRGDQLIDEHIQPICMRYYYPQEFTTLIEKQGFAVEEKWGGYLGEKYGEGGELIISFRHA